MLNCEFRYKSIITFTDNCIYCVLLYKSVIAFMDITNQIKSNLSLISATQKSESDEFNWLISSALMNVK